MIPNRIATLALIFAFLTTFVLPLLVSESSAAENATESMYLNVRLDGPSILGVGVDGKFVLRIWYSFKERIVNYSYSATIIEEEVFGGAISPTNGTSGDGIFNLTITGASTPGTMIVQVNATADEFGKTWYRIERFEIEIVNSVIIKAPIENKGSAPVNNVSVKMLVDGVLVEEKRISLNPISRIDVTFNWTFSSIAEGRHVITLIIDDPSGVAEFSEGNNVLTKEVYYVTSGNWLRGILALAIMFIAFVLIMTLLQKSTKKRKT